MCGIVGCQTSNMRAFQQVMRGLEMLEYRGYDSWGVAGKTDSGSLFMAKRVGNIRERQRMVFPASMSVIGHTRWATHGGVSEINAHPHADNEQRFVVVHNGVIENWQEIKRGLPASCVFISDTDTEVIPHLLFTQPESLSFADRLFAVSKMLSGSNAFAVLDTHTNQLGAVCGGSPLLLGKGKGVAFVVSDVTALPASVGDYVPLVPGMVAVCADMIWSIENAHGLVSPTWLPAPAQLKRFPISRMGQMMKAELAETPKVVIKSASMALASLSLSTTHTVWLTGAGTAHHAALWGAMWLRAAGITAMAFPASESASYLPIIKPTDAVWAISQSGETRDTLSVLEACSALGIPTVGLVNREHSSMSRVADTIVMTGAGIEQAVLATKSLTSQLVVLKRLAETASLHLTDWKEVSQKLGGLLRALPTLCSKMALRFKSGAWTAVIGRGTGWPLAMEMALKLKEGAYIPADGLAGGELKHGPLALVWSQTLCVVMDVDSEYRTHVLQNAAEVKARGGTIIGISPTPNSIYDDWIPLPDLNSTTVLAGLLASQYLTYRIALVRGINPDRPRNLAKSVTVE